MSFQENSSGTDNSHIIFSPRPRHQYRYRGGDKEERFGTQLPSSHELTALAAIPPIIQGNAKAKAKAKAKTDSKGSGQHDGSPRIARGAPVAESGTDYSACYECAACFAQSCSYHDTNARDGFETTAPTQRRGTQDGSRSDISTALAVQDGQSAASGHQRVVVGVGAGGGASARKSLFVQAFWRNGPGQGSRRDAGDPEDTRRRLRQRLAPPARGPPHSTRGGPAADLKKCSSRLMFVFFHGNYFTHALYQHALESVRDCTPHGMLAVELRGYTENTSAHQKATEESVYEDARAAINFLMKKHAVRVQDIVLCGYSMGTAVAVQMAVEYPLVHSVLLFAPVKSITDAAHLHTRLPLSFLESWMGNRFESDLKIDTIRAPIIMVHGLNDEVLPFWHAEYLYAHATQASCRALFVTRDLHAPESWPQIWNQILFIYHSE